MHTHCRLESLESRRMLSVSLDAKGWTDVAPSKDTRIIYVSSSKGKDSNTGLNSSKPVKSLEYAMSLLRSGRPDWLLLKAGDVWYSNFKSWTASGRSAQEPMVISSYGKGERPVIESGASSGFVAQAKPISHLVINGLYFHANTRDPDSPDFKSTAGGDGLSIRSAADDILVENSVFDAYRNNISIQATHGPITNIRIRKSIVTDAYSTNSHSQGLYASGVNGLLLEDNVFDHNGWSETLKKAVATVFNHNVYLPPTNSNFVARGNIFANASSHGLQARCGGKIQGNIFIRNPIGLSFGLVNGGSVKAGGVDGDVSGNVFLGSANIGNQKRGWAIEIGNTKRGGTTIIEGNVFAHDRLKQFPAIVLTTGKDVKNPKDAVGINDVTIEGNVVYDWYKALEVSSALSATASGAQAISDVSIVKNDFQQIYSLQPVKAGSAAGSKHEWYHLNRYSIKKHDRSTKALSGGSATFSSVDPDAKNQKARYFAPDRSIEKYNASLGGRATAGSFLTQARLQSRRYWRGAYSAEAVGKYIRSGFKEHRPAPTVTATNLSSRNTRPASKAITFWFSQDVSASLVKGDLVIKQLKNKKRINSKLMSYRYDPETDSATWGFTGLKGDKLPAGSYVAILPASTVNDHGIKLDGNANGKAGDDFSIRFTIR